MSRNTLRKLISLAMLCLLGAMFSILSDKFLTLKNVLEILRDASVVGIVGIGLTYVILTSGIDLSTGSIMALSGMVMANIYVYTLWPIWVMIVAGVAVGALCGLVNGLVVARLKLPEFIATLATMGIFRSLNYAISIRNANGVIQSQAMKSAQFTVLGKSINGVFYVIIVFLALGAIGQIVLKRTRVGTNLYAVGSNSKGALLSGVNISRVRIGAYVATGLLSGIGAVFTTARLQSTNVLLGNSFNFDPIAAAVVGGCALSGGSGDVVGTMIGAVFMAALENGVLKLSTGTAYQYIVKGVVLIIVVIFDAWYVQFITRRSRKRRELGGGEAK